MDLDRDTRRSLSERVANLVERHTHEISQLPVAPQVTPNDIRDRLSSYDLEAPISPVAAVEDVAEMLTEATVHTSHPRYFGLFNPAPTFMGMLGDQLTAAFNPQLAVWSHAPAANEIERYLLEFFGRRVGFEATEVCGSFTTGGAEANLTAVLVALARRFPEAGERGVRDLDGQPTFYASEQSHLAWLKIAHACGLGRAAVKLVPVGKDLALDVDALNDAIERDRHAGQIPFLVAATAGTTSAGVIDPLNAIADVCRTNDLFFHVDAAWGGATVLSDRLRPLLKGIERADSVTIDAHKWLSIPMGAGMFLTRDAEALATAFRVSTSYMPSSSQDLWIPIRTPSSGLVGS